MAKARDAWKTREWREGRKLFKDPRLVRLWDTSHERGTDLKDIMLKPGKIFEFIDDPPEEWVRNLGLKPGEGIIRIFDDPRLELHRDR